MHIREATRADLSDIATLITRAMLDDELCLWLMPNQKERPDFFRERCLHLTKRRFNNGYYIQVAELDESDVDWNGKPKIVGYAAYEKEVSSPSDSSRRSKSVALTIERTLHTVEDWYQYYFRNYMGTNMQNLTLLNKELTENKDLYQFERFWELSLLAVDPDFGRRGIGALLIAWGKARATEDNVPLWLWASEMGAGLYYRQGFRDFAWVKNGRGSGPAPAMVWKPATLQ